MAKIVKFIFFSPKIRSKQPFISMDCSIDAKSGRKQCVFTCPDSKGVVKSTDFLTRDKKSLRISCVCLKRGEESGCRWWTKSIYSDPSVDEVNPASLYCQ